MLPRKNVLLNFILFKMYSCFKFLPISIDFSSGKVKLLDNEFAGLLWKLNFLVSCAHATFINFRLIQAIVDPNFFVLHHIPLHFVQCFLFTAGSYYSYLMFVKWPVETIASFNMMHDFIPGMTGSEWIPLRTLNLQGLLLMSFPISLLNAGILATAFYFYDRSQSQLLYSVLSTDHQNWSSFLGLLVLQFYIFTFSYANIGFGIYLQLSCFQKCTEDTDSPTKYIRDARRKSCESFRILQLLLQIFNDSQSEIIFIIKIFCLSASVLFFCFGVQHLHVSVIVSLYFLSQGCYGLMSFVIIYDKAFCIPDCIVQLKRKVECGISVFLGVDNFPMQSRRRDRRMHKTIVASYRVLGVRVGHFKYMERESTPEFIGFVISNVSSLLVATR